jgi:hypothetical protein
MTKKEQIKQHNPFLDITLYDILTTLFPEPKYLEMIVNLIKRERLDKKTTYSSNEIVSHFKERGQNLVDKYSGNRESFMYSILGYEFLFNEEQYRTIDEFISNSNQKLLNGVDLTSIKQYEDLNKLNSLCEIKKMGNELEKEIVKLLENDEWLVLRPLTHLSSMKYGSSTKWCTTSQYEPNYFTRYTREGALIYCINKLTGLKVAAYKNYDEKAMSFWNMEDNRIDSLESGLPFEILVLIKEEIGKNKTNREFMSEDMSNKEAIYLLRFEYGEKKLVSLEQPAIGRDYPMEEPMMEQPMEETINEARTGQGIFLLNRDDILGEPVDVRA